MSPARSPIDEVTMPHPWGNILYIVTEVRPTHSPIVITTTTMSLGDGRKSFLLGFMTRSKDHHTLSPAKFPELHGDDSIPPPVTRENPGQVMHRVSLRRNFLTDPLFTRFTRK